MRKMILRTVAASLMVAAAAGSASAETVLQSLQQVMAQGFEIKSVMPVPGEMMAALGRKPGDPPEVLITLQRGGSFAVCELAIANWNTLPQTSLQNPQLCSVAPELTLTALPAAPAEATPATPAPAPAN